MSIALAFRKFPRLETNRLILREMHLCDADALYQILSDEAVTQYYDDEAFTDISQAQDQIESWENGYKNRWSLRWGIALNSGGGILGTCGYYGFHTWHQRAAIGYELARSHWRKGLMTEALTAILNFGFEVMELNRVQASVIPGNISSIRLLENLGFANEGLLAQYENWGGKGFVDLYMFGLLKTGWLQK
jgi:ribosomal-protein-alanine N-acetyltransferase